MTFLSQNFKDKTTYRNATNGHIIESFNTDMIFIDHVDLIFIYWKNRYHLMLKCGGMLFPIFLVLTVFSTRFNRSLCVVLSILVSLDLDNPKIESLDQFLTQLFKVCDFSFKISNNLGHNIVATGLNVQFAWKLWYTFFQKEE